MVKIQYPFVCAIDNSKFRQAKLFLAHKMWHKLPHRPFKSFPYFMYSYLKEMGLINRYMTWDYWNCYEFFNWNDNRGLYEMWQDSLNNTCHESPCYECWLKSIQRTTVDRPRVLGNGEAKTVYVPRSFRTTKSGLKVYIE